MSKSSSSDEQIVDTLLHYSNVEPDWHKLSRPIKRRLLRRIGSPDSIDTRSPIFYKKLATIWNDMNKKRKDEGIKIITEEHSIECAICMETYNLDDKTTSLLCGHKFCTTCVFKYIKAHGINTACPLCRANVFECSHADTSQYNRETQEEESETLNRKREKRKLERRAKRERDRKKKENL